MRAFVLMILLASFSAASLASESCAVRATQLLAEGKNAELSAWFKSPAPDTLARLQKAAAELGSLGRIEPASSQRPGRFTRRSVVSENLPFSYPFEGSWADAVSSKLGSVQIQASVEPGSACRLLALHIDIPGQ